MFPVNILDAEARRQGLRYLLIGGHAVHTSKDLGDIVNRMRAAGITLECRARDVMITQYGNDEICGQIRRHLEGR
ncbi:MAG: hypothetical protein KIT22_16540 [Verrucomicrobiae bacterium]|nr:hypothetical protein [Verrucomicrobiae bacterium]